MTKAQHHGKNIRSIRQVQGMKQKIFALRMGVTQQYVSKLENQKKLSPDSLNSAAKALGISAEVIINYSDTEVIQHYQDELKKKDQVISLLKSKLEECRMSSIGKGEK